jgi:hypothetical protein
MSMKSEVKEGQNKDKSNRLKVDCLCMLEIFRLWRGGLYFSCYKGQTKYNLILHLFII